MVMNVLLVTGSAKAEAVKFHYRDLAVEIAKQLQAEGKPVVVQALVRLTDPDSRLFEARGSIPQLDRLAAHPVIASVETEFDLGPDLKQGLALIGADQVRSVYNGRGVAIALIDSGIDPTHPLLGGSVACDEVSFRNGKVIGGWDTGEKDALPCDSASHGTSVAGIAAGLVPADATSSHGDYVGGVAPGAKLYALKITKANGRPGSNAYLAALRWIAKHWNDDPENPILVVSNSNTWNEPTDESCNLTPNSYEMRVIAALTELDRLGIAVFNSAGNRGAVNGVQWPACMDLVNAVGAVMDTTDEVLKSSNSGQLLALFAPASPATTLAADGGFTRFGTTSAATPYVAGSAAVIQQAAKLRLGVYLTPTQLLRVMQLTGRKITDPKSKPSIERPRIDLAAAIRLVQQLTPDQVPAG